MTDLDNFAFLLGDTSRVLRARFDQRARAEGVTRTQWLVMLTLMRNEGASQAQIAEQLEVEPITLSRMINRLEAVGYVARVPHASDRRVKHLVITDQGRELLLKLRALGAEVMAETSRGVSPEEIALFARIVVKFRANLIAAGEPAVEKPIPDAQF